MSSPRPSSKHRPPPDDASRLRDYLEGERALLELRCCEPKVLGALIHDLAHPMSPSLEQAIARCLANRELEFAPAETLLPVMMRRFSLDPAACGRDPAIHALRTVCSVCPKVATCWLALRQDAPLVECGTFCPNAEALAGWATRPSDG
ncbi:MAG: hypothetical protein LPK20_14845 [Halomonas sp.]|jgi:hypothetical protein|uniref:Uncharacterized protein n=1 Tax=Billgrantia tianxiuensis TaxID=2497861 RepID=A0A6I6SDB4_9GAMM|nr:MULTISPECIES: hypothetical protein [Halomonas]MCE8035993.1 hypothetical protein [Halomonas sp. MCCC 1A11057]MDX5434834.1 hypothetical protein [Halomonas sp.]QHC48369.1 hypothetical protein EKK97_00490 [Halomonas tianxiuensis]